MVRIKVPVSWLPQAARRTATRMVPSLANPWTSSQRTGDYCVTRTWKKRRTARSKAATDDGPQHSRTYGTASASASAFEDALRQLPTDARVVLADALTSGRDAADGNQPTLAAARLSCKVLREVIDDGLHSLRLSVLPDTDQGPAPSLSRFPNVTSLNLSIDVAWRAPKPNSNSSSAKLLPGEQPTPPVRFPKANSDKVAYTYPPSLLLEPLQGQAPASLHRLEQLTMVGQLNSFEALCKGLRAAFGTGGAPVAGHGPGPGPSTSTVVGHDTVPVHPEDADDLSSSEDENDEDSGEPTDTTNDDTASSISNSDSDEAMGDEATAGAACSTGGDGGAGAGAGGGGRGSRNLVHLHLGNVLFPMETVSNKSIARGHAALGPLGLQELTLGVELLAGIQAHKALRRLHVYRHSDCENVRIAEPQAACLRHLPLTHMGLLGCGWDEEDLGPVLSELPDTVTSVCVSSPFKAALRMGHDDRGQLTRELVLGDVEGDDLEAALRVLSAWPRGLPECASLTSVKLGGIDVYEPADMDGFVPLLARAKQVEWRRVTLAAEHVAEVLPRLHPAILREVRLQLPCARSYSAPDMELRWTEAVLPAGGMGAGGAGSSSSGAGSSGGGSGSGAGGDADARGKLQGLAASPLPSLEVLVARATEMMVARASLGGAAQVQVQAPGRGQREGQAAARGPGVDSGVEDSDNEDEDDDEEQDGPDAVERWWQNSRPAWCEPGTGAVLLLSGLGVSALGSHSTAEGRVVLESALGELPRARSAKRRRKKDRKEREYMVLPGGGGVLLHRERDEEGLAAAAAKAVRGAAAAALGREVPEGGVRAVELPHCNLVDASLGLDACACKVLRAAVPLAPGGEELAGQLQAVVRLWTELQAQWDNPLCAVAQLPARKVARPGAVAGAQQAAAAPEADAAAKVAAAVAAGTDAGTATADEAAGPSSSTAAGGGTNSNVGPVAATGASGERAQLRGSKRRRAAGRG